MDDSLYSVVHMRTFEKHFDYSKLGIITKLINPQHLDFLCVHILYTRSMENRCWSPVNIPLTTEHSSILCIMSKIIVANHFIFYVILLGSPLAIPEAAATLPRVHT